MLQTCECIVRPVETDRQEVPTKLHALAGKKQSKSHIEKRLEARRLNHSGRYFASTPTPWNKGKTKESDERIAKYASKSIKGRKIQGNGYIGVYVPEHPFACRGYVMEHRIVVEKSIGRFLYAHEEVHHMNENKQDNRIENLMVMTKAEHAKHHAHVSNISKEVRLDNWEKRREKFGPSGGNSEELYRKMWQTRRERYGVKGIKY